MSRQNRNLEKERKSVELKSDAPNSSERFSKQQRENRQQRVELRDTNGLDRQRLNDLYERSSV